MTDPVTWIDVADSAVKIGLGALIGGAIAVWTAHLNDRMQNRKALNDRRRKGIESVLGTVDTVCNSASLYWANLANAIEMRGKGEDLSADQLAMLGRLESAFFEGFVKLSSSAAKLLLLKETMAEAELKNLRGALDDFFRIANIGRAACTLELLLQHKQELSIRRRAFYKVLSEAYERSA